MTCRCPSGRLYRLEPAPLGPLHDWLSKYERALAERLDRLDDYLTTIQREAEPQ